MLSNTDALKFELLQIIFLRIYLYIFECKLRTYLIVDCVHSFVFSIFFIECKVIFCLSFCTLSVKKAQSQTPSI